MTLDYRKILLEAEFAATAEAIAWMNQADPTGIKRKNYQMLDLCGNAYIRFKDKRSVHYKAFKKLGLLSASGTALYLHHSYESSQAHGLHVAAYKAGLAVLKSNGITDIQVHDYID
jgi:hypothetical protein